MKRSKIKEFFGLKIIANDNTKELHKVEKMTDRCRLTFMHNARYVSNRKAEILIKQGYNGCRYCNKEKDTD
jgi:hypothetical protein